MEWAFFPANFLFNLAPLLYWVVGAMLGFSLGLYTWETANIAFAVWAETRDTLSAKLLHDEVFANRKRIKINLALVMIYVYILGGAFTGSLPKNTIPTRDRSPSNANTAYLMKLDQRDVERKARTPDPERVPFSEFKGWDKEEMEQLERINRSIP